MKRSKSSKKEFKVIIESGEDGWFVASVPALPGCYTQGRTMKELMDNIKDAIRLCLDVAKDDPNYRNQIKKLGYEPNFVGVDLVTI